MLVPGLSENSVLLVRAAELLQGGGVSDALFENMVVVASLPSKWISDNTYDYCYTSIVVKLIILLERCKYRGVGLSKLCCSHSFIAASDCLV